MISLPIDSHLPAILDGIAAHPNFVLQASPGSGKTTRLPPAILKATWFGNGELWVLEPRRLAAKWAANRIAEELGERAGETVGYQFRWEKAVGPKTRLLFLTEGTFLKRLQDNPTLKGVSAVILDEFHERHLQTDVALACLRSLQAKSRPDLKLILCSATIDVENLVAALAPCGRTDIVLPMHPVEIRYREGKRQLETETAISFLEAHRKGEVKGHTLIFLPGMSEMRRTAELLQKEFAGGDYTFHLLHGDLDREEQDAAIRPSAKKKVILSTNIAESSLTIEGVTLVIDAGLFRQLHESPWSGIPRLRLRPISRASATQRTGRAGRTGPGICIRLYSRGDFEARPPYEVPEIRRADLTETYLSLKDMSFHTTVKWLEPPDAGRSQAALRLLTMLGAVDEPTETAPLNEIGREMARLPVSPRLARVLVEAKRRGVSEEAAALVARFSEEETPDANLMASFGSDPRGFASQRVFRQLKAVLPRSASHTKQQAANETGLCFLAGFPDRVAKRKSGKEWLLSEGGIAQGASLPDDKETWYLALDVQETERAGVAKTMPRISLVIPVEEDWLFEVKPSRISEKVQVDFDSGSGRLVQMSSLSYAGLPILEGKERPTATPEAAEALLEKGIGLSKIKVLGASVADWPELLARLGLKAELENILNRVALAHATIKDSPFPQLTGEALWAMLVARLTGIFSANDAKEVNWRDAFVEWLTGGRTHLLEEWVPSYATLPRGRRVPIVYERGNKAWIESRLQDFFGATEGPSILKGRMPLTLNLLAPNGRAVQVTSDLKGFWTRHYPDVRKELSRRYPRHAWPENPLVAPPEKKREPRR